MKLFFCCSTVDYLHLSFIGSAVRVWEWDGGAKTQWDPVGMEIILKLGHANGKELGGNGSVKKPIPGHLYRRNMYTIHRVTVT